MIGYVGNAEHSIPWPAPTAFNDAYLAFGKMLVLPGIHLAVVSFLQQACLIFMGIVAELIKISS